MCEDGAAVITGEVYKSMRDLSKPAADAARPELARLLHGDPDPALALSDRVFSILLLPDPS